MSTRIVIISDTHLGRARHAARSVDALRPLWSDATDLVINGDAAEVHHPRCRADAARAILRLHELCEQDDVRLTLLSGNHDPFISDRRMLKVAGGDVLVTHGDAMHPAIAPWSPAASRLRESYDRAMAKLPKEQRKSIAARLSAAQHCAHEEWDEMSVTPPTRLWKYMLLRPWYPFVVLHYWRVFPKLAAEFAALAAPEARYVIVGHTHRQNIRVVQNRTIINTGSFGFPGSPRVIVLQDRTLSVHRVRFESSAYAMDLNPIAQFELQAAVESPAAPAIARNTRPGGVRPIAAAM